LERVQELKAEGRNLVTFDTVVLDVDGTLVDSVYARTIAWKAAFREVGVEVPSHRIHRAIGMGGDRVVAHLAGDAVAQGVGDEVLDGVRRRVRLAHALVGRHADHEIGEVVAGGMADAHAAQLHRLAQGGEGRADPALRVARRPVHQHLDRLPRQAQRQPDHEHGDEQRGDRVGARCPGRDEDRAREHGE
jgi:hypothetical protein